MQAVIESNSATKDATPVEDSQNLLCIGLHHQTILKVLLICSNEWQRNKMANKFVATQLAGFLSGDTLDAFTTIPVSKASGESYDSELL